MACHLSFARKEQDVEVFDTRRRWWRAARSAGAHAARAQQLTGRPVKIVAIQEAGLDGFWVHRLLEANGVESHVVDQASIAVPRRRRRAKTDAIDGETLLRTLLAWTRGEPRVCAMVVPPTPEEGGRRRVCRERAILLQGGYGTQPHQGSARRIGHHGLQSTAQGSPSTAGAARAATVVHFRPSSRPRCCARSS